MVDILVRDCSIDDANALAMLTTQLGYATDAAQMRSRLMPILESRDIVTLEAERAGRVVGYVGAWCGPSYETDARHARVMAIVVDSAERRAGVASRLMREIDDWAQERGAVYIVLGSGRHRTEAHAFYDRLGYEARGHRYMKRLDSPSDS